jgi:hypothetical protein
MTLMHHPLPHNDKNIGGKRRALMVVAKAQSGYRLV